MNFLLKPILYNIKKVIILWYGKVNIMQKIIGVIIMSIMLLAAFLPGCNNAAAKIDNNTGNSAARG